MPDEKNKTIILIKDNRGSEIQVTLFLTPNNLNNYINGLVGFWSDYYDGNADQVFFSQGKTGIGSGMAEWLPPDKPEDVDPHGT